MGAVFALTTSVVYAAFSWSRSHNSGYATGAYLPNQSYQIINDTLPNGVPYGAGAKSYEVALQYSYDYDFNFYVEYQLVWVKTTSTTATTTSLDTSNVILEYANRDSWIVDNSKIYYRDTVSAGTGKLPIIVGVDFAKDDNETYFGHSLQIKITNVKIVKSTSSLDTTGTAGSAWAQYQRSKLSTYTGTSAYVVVYNPTDKGGYAPKAPVGKTAFRSGNVQTVTETRSENNTTTTATDATIKEVWGNKNYVGLGIYVITGSTAVNIKAKVIGSWIADDSSSSSSASDVHIVSNTIKYDYSDGWIGESYEDDNTQVQEVRTYTYTIPAHSAVYVQVVDSVELTTRGYYANSDYSGFHVKTQLNLNGSNNIDTPNGIGVKTDLATITPDSSVSSQITTMPTRTYSVVNTSKYDAALFQATATVAETQHTQLSVINNTANKLSVSATYKLKVYVSNGNSTAEYGQIYDFNDATHWARKEETLTNVNITKGLTSGSVVIAPYSMVTICSEFSIPTAMYTALKAINSNYAGSDIWCVLEPTITATTSTATDSQLALQTEVVNNKAKFYVKNISTSTIYAYNLSVSYMWLNTQSASSYSQTVLDGSTQSKPDNWERNYWKYYTLSNSKYTQNTSADWQATKYYLFNGWQTETATTANNTITIAPGEKVYVTAKDLNNSQIYDFSNATLTATVATTVSDVMLANETTGLTYLINNSTTKSYYVRFNGTTTNTDNFFKNGSYTYFYGLIRPGQVVPIGTTASTSQLTVSVIEDTTGVLLSSAEFTAKGWADIRSTLANMFN